MSAAEGWIGVGLMIRARHEPASVITDDGPWGNQNI